MEQHTTLKKDLIKALKGNDFEVEIEEPNNVEIRQKYDGSEYLYLRGDSEKFGVYFGSCTVTVLGHSFTCDLDFGEWSAEESEDEWLLDDKEFIDALESADGVLSGIMGEPDEQAIVYCRANKIEDTLPVYWCEWDDVPKNIDELDFYDPVPVKVSVDMPLGDTQDIECDLPCDGIYQLYCSLKENDMLFHTPTVPSSFIKDEVPDLYQTILDELKDKIVISEEVEGTGFSLKNTKEFFESILG